MDMEALPGDVWALLLRFLGPAGLLRTSQTSGEWRRRVLRLEAPLWRAFSLGDARLSVDLPGFGGFSSWKQLFLRHRVFRFQGLLESYENEAVDDRAFVKVERATMADWWSLGPRRMSLDMWICLLPSATEDRGRRFMGGVVLGQQSSACDSPSWPHLRHHLVVVDANCNLNSCLLDGRPISVRRLTERRWYHVAITFECPDGSAVGRQDIFVDGELAASVDGRLQSDWQRLTHCQVGTGYIAAGLHAWPTESYRGWYGFNGLIDEFRIWSAVLTEHEIHHLATLRCPELLWADHDLWFSLQRDACNPQGIARFNMPRPAQGTWVREL